MRIRGRGWERHDLAVAVAVAPESVEPPPPRKPACQRDEHDVREQHQQDALEHEVIHGAVGREIDQVVDPTRIGREVLQIAAPEQTIANRRKAKSSQASNATYGNKRLALRLIAPTLRHRPVIRSYG